MTAARCRQGEKIRKVEEEEVERREGSRKGRDGEKQNHLKELNCNGLNVEAEMSDARTADLQSHISRHREKMGDDEVQHSGTTITVQGCPLSPCRFSQDYIEVGNPGNKLSDPRVGSSHVLPPHVNGFADADVQGCHLSPCRLLNIGGGAVDLKKIDESEVQHGCITISSQGCPFSPCRFDKDYVEKGSAGKKLSDPRVGSSLVLTRRGSIGNKLSDPRVGSSHVLPPHVNGFIDAAAQGGVSIKPLPFN